MHFLDLTLPAAAENLALDEALLLAAEAGDSGEVLRVWEWPNPAVVLGSGCRIAEDVNESACVADAVPMVRRSSGGGTVLLGQGCLLYTLILNYQRDPALSDIRSSYRFILRCIARALAEGGAVIEQVGVSDLAIAGRKFSGSAQQRKRSFLLHHGTLLYAFELPLIARYLREPPRQPEYRGGRGHLAFLRNLPLDGQELKRRLGRAWAAESLLSALPVAETRRLAIEKYMSPGWTRRR